MHVNHLPFSTSSPFFLLFQKEEIWNKLRNGSNHAHSFPAQKAKFKWAWIKQITSTNILNFSAVIFSKLLSRK